MEGVYSALGMPDLEHWVHCWTSQCKKYTGLLKQIQSRATKMVKELEQLLYHQRLKEMGLFRLRIRRFRGISSTWINTQLEGMKKRQMITGKMLSLASLSKRFGLHLCQEVLSILNGSVILWQNSKDQLISLKVSAFVN